MDNHLFVSTTSTFVSLCGSRDHLDILASFYSGNNQLGVALAFTSIVGGLSNNYKFQIEYYGKIILNYELVTLLHVILILFFNIL